MTTMQNEVMWEATMPRPPAFRQTIVIGRPPMFEEIALRFPGARGPGVIFSWGDKIYSLSPDIHPALMVHEAVHGERQGTTRTDIETWWHHYIINARFRFEEEKPAHIAEWQYWREGGFARRTRRAALVGIAARLASPLYGHLITKENAKVMLTSLGEQPTSA